jgi:hypothetical protein
MAQERHSPRKRVALVAEGVSEANEPGIHNPDREYRLRACAEGASSDAPLRIGE